MNIDKIISNNKENFISELNTISNLKDLENLKIKYLGRNGILNELVNNLKNMPVDQKRIYGPKINNLKTEINTDIENKKAILEDEIRAINIYNESNFDVTAYKPYYYKGSLHPYTHLIEQIEDIFISMGYNILNGPEVETEYHNFDALNIAKDHPAREMHDTFWLNLPKMLLRTHTSTVQVHAMKNKKPPMAIVALGRCYRNEATDASHDVMFMQLEVLLIDKNINISNLLGTANTFLKAFFKKENLSTRLRPSYFPFVEPGVEIDISCIFCSGSCPICKSSGWIELCGAGLVHPYVLTACNIDPNEYSGFALGFGLTRLAMLQYGIPDIRLLHSNKIDFLEQF